MSNLTVTATYKGHPVITGETTNFQYNQRHLENNLNLLETMVERHNKVLTFRMDIRLPQESTVNNPTRVISSFMSSFTNNLSRKKLDPGYVVKMEQQISGNPHFHCQILVDGNKVKDYRPLVKTAESLLAKQLKLSQEDVQGLIHYCGKNQNGNPIKNGTMIRRNSTDYQDQFDAVYQQMSYLAKQKPGDAIPSSVRKVFYSRDKRKRSRSTC